MLLCGLMVARAAAQIPGSHAASAFIYQDVLNSGLGQVLAYDRSAPGPPSAGGPPPVTFPLGQANGVLSTPLSAAPGQIVRWEMWGQRASPPQWYLLDIKAALPIEETLTVASPNTINPHLTRMGKTYGVTIAVAGLPTYATGATEVGQVYLGLSAVIDSVTYGFRSLANYASAANPPVADSSAQPAIQEYGPQPWFIVNGTTSIPNLAPQSPGQETWLMDWIVTRDAAARLIDQSSMTVLAAPSLTVSPAVQPVYTGDVTALPSLTFNVDNLFPGSLTILQVLDDHQNVISTKILDDDRARAQSAQVHPALPLVLPLSSTLPQPGTYTLKAWTAEPFSDGIPAIPDATTPQGYTWSALPIPGVSTFLVKFTAHVSGTIITD